MKRLGKLRFLTLLLSMALMLILASCNSDQSGNTIDEPEITADYLTEDYSQQLLTDGAETMTGAVSLEGADGSYTVHIIEKEVVASDSYDEGYYIADTNVVKDVALGPEARIVCAEGDELMVSDADGFMEHHANDSDELFTIYLMGDSAELIVIAEPKALLSEEE